MQQENKGGFAHGRNNYQPGWRGCGPRRKGVKQLRCKTSEEYLEGGNVDAAFFAVKSSYWELDKKLLSACCGKMYNKPFDKGRVLLCHSYGVMLFCRPQL